jgi:molecular chaperone GrpE (heat shock protein)
MGSEEKDTELTDEAIAGTVGGNQADELAAANDRLLRLQAEMQNLRTRTSREISGGAARAPRSASGAR